MWNCLAVKFGWRQVLALVVVFILKSAVEEVAVTSEEVVFIKSTVSNIGLKWSCTISLHFFGFFCLFLDTSNIFHRLLYNLYQGVWNFSFLFQNLVFVILGMFRKNKILVFVFMFIYPSFYLPSCLTNACIEQSLHFNL